MGERDPVAVVRAIWDAWERGSGVNGEMPVYWHAFFAREGKVVRVEVRRGHDVALSSAGT